MKVIAYTDGSCLGNGGENAPGGYGVVIKMLPSGNTKEFKHEISGGIRGTTNNRAELIAVIETLKQAKVKCDFEFRLDSKYVIGCATGYNIKANKDLWNEYVKERAHHGEVKFSYIPGHKGHPDNERANQIAQLAAAKESMQIAIEEGREIELKGKTDNITHIVEQLNGKEISHVNTKYKRN